MRVSVWFLAVTSIVLSAPAAAAGTRLLVAQLSAISGDDGAHVTDNDAPSPAVLRAAPRLAALGLQVRRGFLDNLATPATRLARAERIAALARVPGFAPERVVLLEAPDSALAENARVVLGDDPMVDWVEPLRTRSIQMEHLAPAAATAARSNAATLDSLPNESKFRNGDQWGLYNIGGAGQYGGIARADVHAIEAWRLGVGANDLKLAIADTGIDPAQPELGGLMPNGSPRIVDSLEICEDSAQTVYDQYGHGTPVTGVVAARTNDGPHFSGRGIAGLCGGDGHGNAGCRIVPIKISPGHTGEATSFDIARAAVYAADVGARAMNLSYAGDGASRIERLGLAYAIVRGCVVVVAAGNKGSVDPTLAQYPSAYASEGLCIQVGATESFDDRVGFSSYGPGLDLMAPGVNIETTFMTYPSFYGATYDGYVAASGTSFAAPFVTAAVGLLAAQRPELQDTDFQHLLRESATDIGAPGVDAQTGWGRLDMGAALAAIPPTFGIWHDEVAADSFHAETSGTLHVGESGPGTLDRVRGAYAATRLQALATVTLPDSFVDSIRVWPRVGGTLAVRGDFQLPYFAATAQVVARSGRTFTLRGYLYRLDDDSCATCTDHYVPLPPEYVRFGFTVIGKVQRGALAQPAGVPAHATALRLTAGPSPFRDALELQVPAAGRLTIHDAAGRLLRRLDATRGTTHWDGRDAMGRLVPPGLYLIRWQGGGTSLVTRAVRIAG